MASLKIRSVELREFRGFRRATVNCDADVVLIYGRNGVGKSTIFDAIEFAMFGANRRLETLRESWHEYLPNVHGDGSFSIGLEFQSGERIDIVRGNDGQLRGTWAGRLTIRDFIYERLIKEGTLGRRNVAAIHELSLATHLLLQSEIAKLAASGTLDSEKLAALTGSGYLERCRYKAEQTRTELRKRSQEAVSRSADVETQRQQKTLDVGRVTDLLTRRDQLVDGLRKQIVGPVFKLEILDRIDEPSVAVEFAAMSGRLRDEIPATDRTVALARTLLSTPSGFVDEAAVRDAVSMTRGEHATTVTAHSELTKRLHIARQSLDRHEGDHSALVARRDLVATVLRDVMRLQEQTARLPEVIADSDATNSVLAETVKRLKASESETAHAEANLAARQSELTRFKSRMAALIDAHERSLRTEAECRRLDGTLSEAEKQVTSRGSDAEAATGAALEARTAFEQEQQSFAVSASDLDQLIGELHGFISGHTDCPLCGTPFGTATSLRRAINEHAERRSQELAGQQRRIDERRTVHSEAVLAEIATINLFEAAMARLTETRERHRRAYASRDAAAADLAMFVDSNTDVRLVIRDGTAEEDAVAKAVAESSRISTAASSEVARLREVERGERLRAERADEERKRVQNDILVLQSRIIAGTKRIGAVVDATALRELLTTLEANVREGVERGVTFSKEARDIERRLSELSRRVTEVEHRLSVEEGRLQDVIARRETRFRQFALLGLPPDATREQLASVLAVGSERVDKLRVLADGTEELARIASSATAADLHKAQSELFDVELQQRLAKAEIRAVNDAQQTITAWEETLRRRVDAAVNAFVIPREAEIDEMFRSLIADPFRFERVAVQHVGNGLQLGLVFRAFDKPSGSPEFFLSAAQMSALALSIFLALARSQIWSNLDTILLDDPVQHLDDLDCVALLDGLRRVARQTTSKQLIISTCDRTLYHQMIRKFSLGKAPNTATLIAMSLEEDLKNGVIVRYDVGGPNSAMSAAG